MDLFGRDVDDRNPPESNTVVGAVFASIAMMSIPRGEFSIFSLGLFDRINDSIHGSSMFLFSTILSVEYTHMQYARSKYHTQLAKASFGEGLDLTAVVYFLFR